MYDSYIIQKFAEKLYTQAEIIVGVYSLVGFFIPIIVGIITKQIAFGLIAGVIFGLGGYFLGQNRAFQIKLQAQTALCQMKIEENTRMLGSQNVVVSESPMPGQEASIFKDESSPIRKSGPTKTPKTPVASNYRTCLKCLSQNPKSANVCGRCGYRFK